MKSNLRKRIAYVQYTNPAGYPPLQHSSQILAEAGWEVLFLGAEAWGAASLRFPDYGRIQVRSLGRQKAGWRQKLHYLFFCGWCLGWILRHRSSWVYASDLFSCPVAALASVLFRIPLVYHEHDSPAQNPSSGFLRMCMWTRTVCGRRAKVCVLPNAERAAAFEARNKPGSRPLVIWNCPRRAEVAASRTSEGGTRTKFLYHGSIVPDRLPVGVVDALAAIPDASLTVVGYETVGSKGYLEVLRRRGIELGIADRLDLVGPLVGREEVLEVCRRHHVGLALMPLRSGDLNLEAMTGASNKPFDYLSCGLALLVSDLPDWAEMFVQPGYSRTCDPTRPASLAAAFRWFAEHPEEGRAMGEHGRLRILSEWNYETQFQPLLGILEGKPSSFERTNGRRIAPIENPDHVGRVRERSSAAVEPSRAD